LLKYKNLLRRTLLLRNKNLLRRTLLLRNKNLLRRTLLLASLEIKEFAAREKLGIVQYVEIYVVFKRVSN
jgi:hypothetical protein